MTSTLLWFHFTQHALSPVLYVQILLTVSWFLPCTNNVNQMTKHPSLKMYESREQMTVM